MHFLELRIPPVVVALLLGCIMWLVQKFVPTLALTIPCQTIIASTLSLAGVALILAGAITFRTAKTTVNPMQPDTASTIVTGSVYKISRNPMYVGILLALVSWAIMLSNILSFALLPTFIWYMNRFQIIPEERALLSKFGAEYVAYTKNVRRWL